MTTETQTQLIETLRAAYARINTIDPCGEGYKKLTAFLDTLDEKTLQIIFIANIKFVSALALNRLNRKCS